MFIDLLTLLLNGTLDLKINLKKAFALNYELIILGDLNLNMLGRNIDKDWLHILNSFNLVQMVNMPTRVTKTTQTLIDHIYVTRPDYVKEIQVPKLLVSVTTTQYV